MFLKKKTYKSTKNYSGNTYLDKIEQLKNEIKTADAIVIGAGAGLSTAAGHSYSGERFEKYFSDFKENYGIQDMYSGGFYPFSSLEEYWGWWARHIYVNRYLNDSNGTYENLLDLVKGKDYFVLTTNVDHQFQKAGFDKKRIFYTQGDYGLWQCSKPCHNENYDNEQTVYKMLLSQGFLKEVNGKYVITDSSEWKIEIDSELIPRCPKCKSPMTMNLRCDDTFVQDEGWYAANHCYSDFIRRHENLHVLFLELGIGMNTPVIIKYPFWKMTYANKNAVYACLNYGEAYAPREIESRSICIDADIKKVFEELVK
ncbi:NAD-dependent protein deacetylase of SIR2 family [Lachnospiraceae bacterium TWA4]|nr:NAD-dependent protein deacetylase of SIR2 family [Lachnospiraceae bacterium TWA4]